MSKRQTMFTQEGLGETDGLTRKDMLLKVSLEKIKVICPRCLYIGTLWEFTKKLKNKRHGHYISMSRVLCPDCTEGFNKKTIVAVADMDMEEFANYFWGGTFQRFGTGDKIRWEIFMKRLKQHYSREDKNIFWEVYHVYKGEKTVNDDDEAYADYDKSYKPPSQEPQIDEHDTDIVTVLKFLVTQKRPIETNSIQYVLTGKVPQRRVTRALETMMKEGTIAHTDEGWALTSTIENKELGK